MTNQIQSFSKLCAVRLECHIGPFLCREREKEKERERKRKERRREKGGNLNISNWMFHRSPKAIMSTTN